MAAADPVVAVAVNGSHPAPQPWKRRFLWCAPGEGWTLGWIIFLHVSALMGLVLLPLPSWPVVVIAFSLIFLGGLGTTVCYHRSLAHRAVTLHPVIEQILIFFAMFNGSGNPRTWVGIHRLHHATSDSDQDISSPHHGGFWWAHLRWLWQTDLGIAERYNPDLGAGRFRFWGRIQIPLLALSAFGGLACGGLASGGFTWENALTAALWIGPIRLLWALHTQCSVNSVCHLGSVTGPHGSGRNVFWLVIAHMGQGENWHGNHHQAAGTARLGQRWWQVDIGWWTIQALALTRLARGIKGLQGRRPLA